MKTVILQVFYALFSGIIEGAAIPNELILHGSPLLALISTVPLYISLYKAKTYKESFLIFFIQTLTVHLISSFWLANFRDFAVFTLGASAAGTAAEGGIVGIIFHALPSLRTPGKALEEESGRTAFAPATRILWFASCMLAYEWFKSVGFLAYPWGTLFLAAAGWKIFAQTASITGVWGITFIYALAGAVIGEGLYLLSHREIPGASALSYRAAARFTAAIWGLAAIYGLYQYFVPRQEEKTIHTVAVQQNMDPWEGGEEQSVAISMRLTEEAVRKARDKEQDVDLVLWSEGVLERSFPDARFHYMHSPEGESLSDFIKRMEVPFVIGGQTRVNRAKRHYCNSAIFFDKEGTYSGFYSKTHLVPFAEDIPFDDNPLIQMLMERMVGFTSGWTPGWQYTLFRIPTGNRMYLDCPVEYKSPTSPVVSLDERGRSNRRSTEPFLEGGQENPDNFVTFSVPICFEDAFADVCTPLFKLGTEVFMNITNDAWSHTASAEYQHYAIASYLAIEYRTTLVRAANSGYTVVLDPAGRVLADLPLFTEAALSFPVPVYAHKETVYSLLGDWLPYTVFVLMALYGIVLIWRARREN